MLDSVKILMGALIALLVACPACEAARAALVHAGLPGEDPAVVSMLSSRIKAAGYSVRELDASELCEPAILNVQTFDLLVLPNAADLPVKSVQAISSYAKAGGNIIALNAPLWQRILINVDGRWTTHDDYQRKNAGKLPNNLLFDFSDVKNWHRSANDMNSPSTYEVVKHGPASGQNALHAVISNETGWDNIGTSGIRNAFPNGNTLTVFTAKGDDRTSQLAIEWREKDGSRWIAVIPLYPEWRRYVLAPKDFKYWQSTERRGGSGDSFKPENVDGLNFGIAFSHTGPDGGRHEFWVGPVGTANKQTGLEPVPGPLDLPTLDTFSPSYKLFDVHGPVSLRIRDDQGIVALEKKAFAAPAMLRSPQPRPGGGGFDKQRDWRWIPIMEARAANGEWRGTPVTMTVNTDGQYKGGVWASFGFDGRSMLKSNEEASLVKQIAERMLNGAYILDGGANFYTYFEDQDVRLGMRVCNVGSAPTNELTARVTVTSPGKSGPTVVKQWKLSLQPGEIKSVEENWRPCEWPTDGFKVVAELLDSGRVIDTVAHKIYVWHPKQVKHFVTIKDGEFTLDGKRWRANGINYMPSSGIGTEDGEYFEHWIGARSYDPEVIDRDLDHIKSLGINAVSAFVYTAYAKDQNMVDLLRRLDLREMKANIGLRPGMPSSFKQEDMKGMIDGLRLADNDTVFAYDIAWEPMFGSHDERKVWDGEWEKWIVERYGSVANA